MFAFTMPEFEPGLLNRELSDVTEWISLGINLGLSKGDLDAIQYKVGMDAALCRLEMLALWYNNSPLVSWPDLINGLVLTCRQRLAHKLALKYRESLRAVLQL